MFQHAVTSRETTVWSAPDEPRWRVELPVLVRPATVVALREDVLTAACRAGTDAFTFLHGEDALPAPVVCWSVDRHAALLRDIAHEPLLVAIAERLLGTATVLLRGDYVLLPPTTQPTRWRQTHLDHGAYVGDGPAAQIWLPLRHEDAAWGAIEFAAYPGHTLVPAHDVADPRLARHLADQDIEPEHRCTVPTGGCVAFDSYAVWRLGRNAGAGMVEGLLLHYRQLGAAGERDRAGASVER